MKVALCALFALLVAVNAVTKVPPRPGMRLISFSDDPADRQWLTEAEVDKLASECGKDRQGFVDVTDVELHPSDLKLKGGKIEADPIPTTPRYPNVVNPLLDLVIPNNIKAFNDRLSAIYTRYYTTQTGVEAANLIRAEFQRIATVAGRTDIEVELFTHSWAQPSVIARIPGTDPALADQVVVIGAHEDSVNLGSLGRAPGADDDGSGVTTVMEIYRVLVEANFRPARTIEFMTYAAEEVGLRGSADIARRYQSQGVDVHAALQLDMTLYTRTPGQMGIITDFVNPQLVAFLRTIVRTYSSLTPVDTRCGYGCSDHASWTSAGYRSAIPFESTFNTDNPYIHSAQDTWDKLNLAHGTEFVYIGIGFAVELSSR